MDSLTQKYHFGEALPEIKVIEYKDLYTRIFILVLSHIVKNLEPNYMPTNKK
jgi:hypothetical protein